MEFKKPDDKVAALPLQEPQDGVFEAYANLVDADWTLTDVSIRFMQLAHIAAVDNPTNLNRQSTVVERAYITLPWWQAKILAGMLTRLVKSYEESNGELKMLQLPKGPS